MSAPLDESDLQPFISSGTPSFDTHDCVEASQASTGSTSARGQYKCPTYTPPGFQSKYAALLARRRSRSTRKQTYTFTDSTPPSPTPTSEQLAQARLLGSEFSFIRSDDNFKPDPYVPTRTRRAREKWYPYRPSSPQDHAPSFGYKDNERAKRETQTGSGTSQYGFVLELKSLVPNKDEEDVEHAETASEIEVEDILDAHSPE